jgi:hypothetical protein
MARASLHIIMTGPDKLPVDYGSGFIVKYRDKHYLLSVAHVTSIEGASACIETNEALVNDQSPLYCVGAMSYFDQFKIDPDELKKPGFTFEDLLNKSSGKTLDITFCNINEELNLLQKEWDFGAFKIEAGRKIYLDLDNTSIPQKGKFYGFCGRVRQKLSGGILRMQVTAKLNLQYQSEVGDFYRFISPEIIADRDDYGGCSGAPILDEDGALVGLAQAVYRNTLVVQAFSIEKCKKLMDLAIATGLLE